MKYLLLITVFFIGQSVSKAQEKPFVIHSITLPPVLMEAENQFSSLQVAYQKIYLMPECRLQDKHEARLYAITLADINQHLRDSTHILPVEKIIIYGLDSLAVQMKSQGNEFEGLEAFIIDKQTVFFSVETTTPSPYCYLVKGRFKKGNIYLEPILTPVRKPVKPGGEGIYNAGFEAITMLKKKIYSFFEYNYFVKNYVYSLNKSLDQHSEDSVLIEPLPFRITDITASGRHRFTGINFFYKGDGKDTVYRVPSTDPEFHFTQKENKFSDYCRLIDIQYRKKQFYWKTLWTFPDQYTGFNWEGIAAYKKGYFIINDKFTKSKPYKSTLLYID